ncbi:MAG: LPS export ABC transporter periplasmic protein LptC [Reinekea sp.]|jgi:LPS export ABC transporter protein LptC
MKPVRNILLWIALIFVGVLILRFLPQEPADQPDTAQPLEEIPDITATGLHTTRIENGLKTIETTADSLASFEARGQTYLTNPHVRLFKKEVPNWNIVSDTATVYTNNDIDFKGNVVVTQLNQTPSVILTTDFIKYSEENQIIATDQPVQAIKGKQRANAIGMRVDLGTINPVIHLLSDVNLQYDPS